MTLAVASQFKKFLALNRDQVTQHFLAAVDIVSHGMDVQFFEQLFRDAGSAVGQYSHLFGHGAFSLNRSVVK